MALDRNVVGRALEPSRYRYTERDVILYALGVGCGPDVLDFVYERDLVALPTFAVVPAFPTLFTVGRALGIHPAAVLHGGHRLELFAPLPSTGELVSTPTVLAVQDKGAAAVIVVEIETVDAEGRLLCRNWFTGFARGGGGFGGERGASEPRHRPPDRAPDRVVEVPTLPQQALLYRLSGDLNPAHADPRRAWELGFTGPTLHGLCTFGHIGRAVLAEYCDHDPARLRSLETRFAGAVYPGETLVIELWRTASGEIVLRARTRERLEVVVRDAAARVS